MSQSRTFKAIRPIRSTLQFKYGLSGVNKSLQPFFCKTLYYRESAFIEQGLVNKTLCLPTFILSLVQWLTVIVTGYLNALVTSATHKQTGAN